MHFPFSHKIFYSSLSEGHQLLKSLTENNLLKSLKEKKKTLEFPVRTDPVDTSDIFTYDIFAYCIFTTLALTFFPMAILPLTFLPMAILPLAFLPHTDFQNTVLNSSWHIVFDKCHNFLFLNFYRTVLWPVSLHWLGTKLLFANFYGWH